MTQLYRHFDKDDLLLYVGISLSTIQRLSQHKRTSHWFDKVTRVSVEKYATREEALFREKETIRLEKPLYNIVHNLAPLYVSVEPIELLELPYQCKTEVDMLKDEAKEAVIDLINTYVVSTNYDLLISGWSTVHTLDTFISIKYLARKDVKGKFLWLKLLESGATFSIKVKPSYYFFPKVGSDNYYYPISYADVLEVESLNANSLADFKTLVAFELLGRTSKLQVPLAN
jgi:hypothetical protein